MKTDARVDKFLTDKEAHRKAKKDLNYVLDRLRKTLDRLCDEKGGHEEGLIGEIICDNVKATLVMALLSRILKHQLRDLELEGLMSKKDAPH